MEYTPHDHYWRHENGTVYGSARGGECPPDDAVYQAWLAAGGLPTQYPRNEHGEESRAELAAVLAPYGLCVHPLTFQEAQDVKLDAINAGYETVMAYVQAGYPLQEVLSWERQATQAREIQGNPEAEALFVRSLAATKGLAVPEMARRILTNAENWEPVAAMLTAQRQMLEEAVYAAMNVEEVEAIKVGYSV